MNRFVLNRRKIIESYFDIAHLSILEFGALDAPTFTKQEAHIYYADFFTQEQLIDKHMKSGKREWKNIVSTDFLLTNQNLVQSIAIKPDLVIANHMFEHSPNPIRWLRELREISHSETMIFFSIPDKRYTFDYFKPISDAVDWIRSHDEVLERPDKYHIIRQLYYHASNNFNDYWAGTAPKDHLHRITMADAIKDAKVKALRYSDSHCFFYTPESFRRILEDLKSTDLVPWQLVEVTETERNSNEFYVLLRTENHILS